MVRSRILSSVTGLALAATCALTPACAPGNPGLVVLGSLTPATAETGGCLVDAAAIAFTNDILADLDAAPGDGASVHAFLKVENRLINRYSMTFPVMADVNSITVTGAEVELVDRTGRRLNIPNPTYRVPATGVVPSAMGDQTGVGLVDVDVIPSNISEQLINAFEEQPASAGTITARVAVIGVTQAGNEIISADFTLLVRFCLGCLYSQDPLPDGVANTCLPGQFGVTFDSPLRPLVPCETSDECDSALCALGRCVR